MNTIDPSSAAKYVLRDKCPPFFCSPKLVLVPNLKGFDFWLRKMFEEREAEDPDFWLVGLEDKKGATDVRLLL